MHMRPYIKQPRQASPASWLPSALCQAYLWPAHSPGGGAIYIVELGGGWHQNDVATAFAAMNLPAPTIRDLSADGRTSNSPGSAADGEVALDIQVAGAAYAQATGKPATIYMVWGTDIAACLLYARQHAGVDLLPFAASGDNNSSDGDENPDNPPANVDCPASCPSVIGCGGTNKPHHGEETVWNDNPGQTTGEGTGGGYSVIFGQEPWQMGVPVRAGRMVPDLAANADPSTGYQIVLNGQVQVFGGTSAVAPLYAGLFAALGVNVFSCSWGADEMTWEAQQAGSCMEMEAAAGAALGGLRTIVQSLYCDPQAFTDITKGENGAYKALVGPDPCTGLGSPIGTALAGLIAGTRIVTS